MATPDDSGSGVAPDEDVAGLSYAEAADELASILERLDRDAVDVDDLARQVRRAAALISHCRDRITRARIEVERVAGELTELAAEAADGDSPDDEPA